MRGLAATGDRSNPITVANDLAEPAPRQDQVLVAVEATSLNRGEIRRSLSAQPGFVPGWDVAGRVLQPAASGEGPAAGTRVVGLLDAGGWAEHAAMDLARLAPLPDSVPAAVAATLPVAGLTALLTLRRGGQLLGRRVAVTGATGGVGMFALQLASLMGAHTTAVVSAPDRQQGLPARGVDAVEVGLDGDDVPFDLVLDSVGGPLLSAALRRIVPGGHIVTYGNTSAEPTSFDVSGFYLRNRATLSAFMLFGELAADPPGGRHLGPLTALVADGRLEVHIDREAPLEEGPDLVRALLDRRIAGKGVVTFS